MSRVHRVVAPLVVITLCSFFLPLAAHGAVDPVVVDDAVGYLSSQQIAGTDPALGAGAWDLSVPAAFTTFDAVLAVAEAAQSGAAWNTSEALAGVAAFFNIDGVNPLPYMDLVGLAATTPGRAGKIITLWAEPLGLDPTAFDPLGDGTPVDLVDLVGTPMPNGAYAADVAFTDTLFAALAVYLVGGTVSPSTLQYVRDGQTAEGSWAYDHDPSNTALADVDTTSNAIQVLLAGGVPVTDPAVRAGLAYIAEQQEADGSWSFYGSPSSETTSRALLAVAAAGYDVNSRCWRDTVLPAAVNDPFVGGDFALSSFAQSNGAIADPSSFAPAYSTGQALEGLLRNWLPVATGVAQTCDVPVTPTDPEDSAGAAVPVALAPRFTG
jgi:hypothetical protein